MASAKGAFYAELGARIRDARKGARVTQDRLASVVGLSRASIVNIEKGRQPVSVEMLVVLGSALNVNPAALIPERRVADDPANGTLEHLSPATRGWISRVMSSPADKDE